MPAEFYALIPAILGSSVLSWFLTREFLKFGPSFGLQDIPNERSSHSVPTLRGGGVGFVGALLLFILAMTFSENLSFGFGVRLFIGCLLVAVVGWIDDRQGVRALYRLGIHFLAAGILVSYYGHSFILLFFIVFVAWMVNLYNFMDGTDGIASVQGITVAGFSAIHAYLSLDYTLYAFYLTVALCIAGFLIFNWSPAKVFMGDVGSGFLGFLFAAMAVYAHEKNSISLIYSLLLMSVFLVDTGYTLIIRLMRRQKLSQAHRTHAYQKVVQKGVSHRQLAIGVTVFNCALGALSLVLRFEQISLMTSFALAWGLILCWQIYLKAGFPSEK